MMTGDALIRVEVQVVLAELESREVEAVAVETAETGLGIRNASTSARPLCPRDAHAR